MLRDGGQALSLNMDDTALARHIGKHILDRPDDIIAAVCRYSYDIVSHVPDIEQIRRYLIIVFMCRKAIEDSPLQVLRAIDDQAMAIREIRPVDEQIYRRGCVYRPGRERVEILIEPPMELTRAVSTLLRDIFDGLLPKNPFAEPDDPIVLADTLLMLDE